MNTIIHVKNLNELINERVDFPRFHIGSEDNVRIEVVRIRKGNHIDALKVFGNVIITVLDGMVSLYWENKTENLKKLDQVVIPAEVIFQLFAREGDATVQLIWSPAFASTEKEKDFVFQ